MAGLDYPGVDRSDGYFVYPFSLGPAPLVFAFYPRYPLRRIEGFPQRPGVFGPVLEFYPWTRIGMAQRSDTHKTLHLPLEAIGGEELFRDARERRVIGRRLCFYDEVFRAPTITREHPVSPSQSSLVCGPFGSKKGI